jgi:hypothetical protein
MLLSFAIAIGDSVHAIDRVAPKGLLYESAVDALVIAQPFRIAFGKHETRLKG